MAGAFDVDWQASSGVFYSDPKTAAHVLHEVVFEAAKHLSTLRPSSQRISRLRTAAEGLSTELRTEARVAWLAGLGTTATTAINRWRSVIKSVSEGVTPEALKASFEARESDALVVRGSCQAALLFGSSSPTLTDQDAAVLAAELLAAYTPQASSDLDEFVRDEPLEDPLLPWEHGYELAEDLLEEVSDPLGIASDSVGDQAIQIERFLERQGVSVANVKIADQGVRAVSFAGSNHQPTILINDNWSGNQRKGGRRFTMAHELCHLLHDRTYGAQLAVASGFWAPLALEQRANAFAAMLLMPPAVLRAIDSSVRLNEASRKVVLEVATGLGVSFAALVDHSYNMNIIDDIARGRLRTVEQD